jgi:hypothetical protein
MFNLDQDAPPSPPPSLGGPVADVDAMRLDTPSPRQNVSKKRGHGSPGKSRPSTKKAKGKQVIAGEGDISEDESSLTGKAKGKGKGKAKPGDFTKSAQETATSRLMRAMNVPASGLAALPSFERRKRNH